MKATDTYRAEIARATTYKLLAECYYPPTERLLQDVKELGRCLEMMGSAASEAVDRMGAAVQGAEGFEELAIDHSRLFVGPFALLAPPFGSVYLERERRLMADSTQAVDRCYREVGLELAEGFNGTPDHIAAELEFMHVLVIQALDALTQGELDCARRCDQKQGSFLERHLAAWVPEFSRSVEEHAGTRFYQGLAAATRMFIQGELDQTRSDLPAPVRGSVSA